MLAVNDKINKDKSLRLINKMAALTRTAPNGPYKMASNVAASAWRELWRQKNAIDPLTDRNMDVNVFRDGGGI